MAEAVGGFVLSAITLPRLLELLLLGVGSAEPRFRRDIRDNILDWLGVGYACVCVCGGGYA